MEKPKDLILRTLGELNHNELVEVKNLIEAKLYLTKMSTDTDEVDWVLQVICEFLKANGTGNMHPSVLRKQAAPDIKTMKEKLPDIMYYFGEAMNKTERYALMRLGIELLHRNLSDIGWTVTSRTLIRNIHRIPACMDREFPFYAKNGLMKLLTKRVETKHVRDQEDNTCP